MSETVDAHVLENGVLVCGMEGDEEASGGFDATIGLLGYLKFSNEICYSFML